MALLSGSVASAQSDTTIVADSLGWTMRRMTDILDAKPYTSCLISRRGAALLQPRNESPVFEVPLADARDLYAGGIEIESMTLQLDNRPPLLRLPTVTERQSAWLILKGSWLLQQPKADTLRVRVTYSLDGKPGAGGHQSLDIDIRGLMALVPRLDRC